MTTKKFSGFNEKQLRLVADKLGYKDSIEGFGEWIAKDEKASARFARMTEKARSYVEDSQDMAEGGAVVKKKAVADDPYKNWEDHKYYGKDPDKLSKYGVKDDKGNYLTAPPGSTPVTKTANASDLSPTTNKLINNPKAVNNAITPVQTSNVNWNKKQLIDKDSGNAGKSATKAKAAKALKANQVTDVSQAQTPETTDANTVGTDLVTDDVKKVTNGLKPAKGTVSDQAQVTAATALPSANATVQGQLEKLMSSFDGNDPPAWAAGAMRMANAAIAQRGLGSSSMAGGAVTQAAMESAISIAATDAATFSAFEMQNLNNRQQARLQNAQAFLQMDLANLNNEQQTSLFKAQSVIQSLFTDQAATNASAQFNATSQNQTDQFFASLKAQVSTFNAAQANSIKTANMEQANQVGMFNKSQYNAVSQFNAQMQNARDEFNANNRLVIDQANAKWRQQIATLDNANINENNRVNAQLSTGLTMAAYANHWQNERDLMSYAFTAAENANERANQIVLAKMQGSAYKDGIKAQNQVELGKAAGSLISSLIDGIWS